MSDRSPGTGRPTPAEPPAEPAPGEPLEVRWERMLPHQLEAAFAARPALWLAYGLCEPHGPHCAVGLDGLKAHALAVAAARAHGGIVAPPDWWHVHELGGYALWAEREIGEVERTWLTAVPPWVHFKNVCYHLRAAEALGFRAAIAVTGHHGPNYLDLATLVERIQPRLRMRVRGLADFELNRPGFPGDGADGDHAGKVESSLLAALEPGLVEMERVPEDPSFPLFAMGRDAAEASPEAGAAMAAAIVAGLGEVMERLLADWDSARPSRLTTFDDVEDFWDREMAPRLGELSSMRTTWYDKSAPDTGSRWRRNWLSRRHRP
jgi:creatinine amidohydrolase